jgi:hypothetical protein
MTEFSSADLCKLSLQDVADMLLDHLEKNSKSDCKCLVHGCSEGKMFELMLCMKEVK